MRSRVLCGVLAAGVAVAAVCGAAEDTPPTQEFELRLFDALFRGAEPAGGAASEIMVLRRRGDEWDRAWGVARDLSVWVNEGRVSQAQLTEKTFELSLDLLVEDGRGKYQIRLTREADGVYRGGYTGTLRGHAVQGKAQAVQLPPQPKAAEGFVPVRPGEHPRILFRKNDVPRLQERARTPWGQVAVGKLSGPGGLGVKYQLTGNRQLADQAAAEVEKLMAAGHHCDQYGNNLGARLEQTALAYDLCYDAWPSEFKRRVEEYMAWAANCVFHGRKDMGGGINWNIVSNWSSPLYTGAGFAGLALWGEPGPEPLKPPPSNCGASVPAPAGYEPGAGVPVSKFASGQMPSEWLYAAGFRVREGEDALAALGGAAAVRPQVGTKVEFGGRAEEFRLLSHEKDKGYYRAGPPAGGGEAPPEVMDLTNACGKAWFSTGYYYTVIENDRRRWVRLNTGHGGGTAFLSGVRLADGDCVGLEPGLHPLLVAASMDWTVSWGRITMQPRLTETTEDEAKATAARRQAEYQDQLKDWQQDADEWKRTGGQNVAWRKVCARGRHEAYVFGREASGTGGFQGEVSHYSQIATHPPIRYLTAHRGMFGWDPTPWADIVQVVPRKMFSHVYRSDGRAVAQEINGYPDADCNYYAAAFPVIREEWKPAVLWAWNFIARGGGRSADPALGSAAAAPLYTLLYYPTELKPQPPQDLMPLTWEAPDFGFYAFRNAWRGDDDFLVQVFLKAHTIGGWNGPNAGTFRVLGLGHEWAVGPHDRNRCRWEENVVMLPADPDINQSSCAHLTHYQAGKDGSGVVSMDMNEVYALPATSADGRRLRLYERYGNIRHDEGLKDSGIRGLRSLAVDYSGRSGAPCLLAVVDRITGGKTKIWAWHLKEGSAERNKPAEPGTLERTKVDGNTFTIRQPDGATLRGTFITRHTLKAEVKQTSMLGGAGSSAGKELPRLLPGVYAEGGDEFFVVVTIQKGEPPAVKVDGEGLQATVTIGGQRVRFDGQKVVFGE